MVGTNANNGGSNLFGSTVSLGSTVCLGPMISTANAQSVATVSTSIGSTQSNAETDQKQCHDGNRSNTTAGGSLNSGLNGGGNGGWPPFGLLLNYTPVTMPSNLRGTNSKSVQFGFVPNNQTFLDISCNMASTSSNQPLSTAVVWKLIEETHLDLVNLLTSHLTTVLNHIVADTNAKYEHLAKRFDSVIRADEGENSVPYILDDEVGNKVVELNHDLAND
ncbi:hypothetical protein PIB30_067519 [Stylosanthes scabra]|uniref:Uncharacterized protein n=1 Tax=Stylosanthes scabra TaxID=79078 RepID=A0ABU6XMX6_9FABA|nr:hypothetical protein [Stylosanthes scabra]